jgi:CheY-like chemotaxis protein
MRVLIIEDDAFYGQHIGELLRDHGVDTIRAATAEEALAEDPSTFDVALVDVMLPNDPQKSGITNEESRGGFSAGIAVARRLIETNTKLKVGIISSDVGGGEAEAWASEKGFPFIRKSDGRKRLIEALTSLGLLGTKQPPLAFIVHGHDESALLELKNYVQNTLKWREPIVLREQAGSGKTIIEKFEDFAEKVDCVFVLLTPDDKSISSGTDEEKRRSRQNVIFEFGFFYGSLGRHSGRVVMLYKGPLELPSDIAGVVWIDIGKGISAAGEQIRKEVAFIGS